MLKYDVTKGVEVITKDRLQQEVETQRFAAGCEQRAAFLRSAEFFV